MIDKVGKGRLRRGGGWGWRSIACRVAMRANSTGHARQHSLAVPQPSGRPGISWLDLGMAFAEMGDGSRCVDSFPPSARAIGWAKRGTRTRRNPATEPGFKPSCDVSFGRSRELM